MANDVVSPEQSAASCAGSNDAVTSNGVVISMTDAIRSFLTEASSDSDLSDNLRDLSSVLIVNPELSYRSLKTIWLASKSETRPNLKHLLSGSSFIFTSPKPREKSDELRKRLKKLEEAAERKAYEELVKDIAPKKAVEEPFSSYKDQLGFGLHVVVTMFTGYLLGYAAFRALFGRSPAMGAAGGIIGLVGAMLVETLLFILRSSNQDLSREQRPPPSNLRIKKNQ